MNYKTPIEQNQYDWTILCGQSKWMMWTGIALIALSVLAFSSLFLTTTFAMYFFGGIIVAAGIIHLAQALSGPRYRAFFMYLMTGILQLIIGALMIVRPMIAAASITLLLATLFMVSGAFKTATALSRELEHRRWLLLNGVITFTLGALILANWPFSASWVIGVFIGVDLLVSGWTSLTLGMAARKLCNR